MGAEHAGRGTASAEAVSVNVTSTCDASKEWRERGELRLLI